MKLVITIILLILIGSADCLSQGRRKQKTEEIKIDTVEVLQRFDNKTFKEKNVFWSDKNEIGIIHNQWYNTSTPDAGYSIELTVIFYNWDSVELNKDYDLADFKSECQLKGWFAPETFSQPHGLIRLIDKKGETLTLYFEVYVSSKSGDKYLIYKGEREFKSDY